MLELQHQEQEKIHHHKSITIANKVIYMKIILNFNSFIFRRSVILVILLYHHVAVSIIYYFVILIILSISEKFML